MNGLKMKYFVLNPTKNDAYGDASRMALRAYADAIFKENSDLACEIQEWVAQLEVECAE